MNKKISSKLMIILVLVICIFISGFNSVGFAEMTMIKDDVVYKTSFTDNNDGTINIVVSNSLARGILVRLTVEVTLDEENNMVGAKCTNEFALGNSTVEVYVYLYMSATNSNINYMSPIASNHANDLDIFHSVEVKVNLYSTPRYWCARIVFSKDGGDFYTQDSNSIYL